MSQFGHSAIDLVLAMLEDCIESIRDTGDTFFIDELRKIITDKLRSHDVAHREIIP